MHSQQPLYLCKPSLCARGRPLRLSEELLRVLFSSADLRPVFITSRSLAILPRLHRYKVMPERKEQVVPR